MTGLTEKMQKVSFRLRYEYDPEKQDLRIRTLLLKAAGVSRTFFINKNQVLPEADKVIAEIVREGQRKRARLIFQRAASRKVHPPTLRKAF
jgi:hypothetical protein